MTVVVRVVVVVVVVVVTVIVVLGVVIVVGGPGAGRVRCLAAGSQAPSLWLLAAWGSPAAGSADKG